ncbi:PAS domain-containing protein [Erythrobacter litoralis]|uniref:PAS domain-containing protein n=1 Tax=Erythrobacter litoralis TaxID=39960 RepID=UPI002434E7FC|nr:PAS domain-containing protein [Erythrobacter litoralis]MDG6078917.1 PAS domain-containing protein [Erythrobacter litoralis]
MTDTDERKVRDSDQAHTAFDTSPNAFRERNPSDTFSGVSGVLFERAMAQTRMAICLTDPQQSDNPIVFANRAFRKLTGYDEEEIIGSNCRFLQGPETDPEQLDRVRQSIEDEQVIVVELLNYRKDGSTFWNALHVGPIYDDSGKLIYFFGSQWDVSEVRASRAEKLHAKEMARELSHRMKNMFAVIAGIVNVTGRVRGVESEASEMVQRIQALGRAYETTLDEASTGYIEVSGAIEAILAPYAEQNDLDLVGPEALVSFSTISMMGLMLHELADNAERFGAWSNGSGRVRISWDRVDEDVLELHWTELGGPPILDSDPAKGAGTQIVDRLLRAGNGSIERRWNASGFEADVRLKA